MSVSGSTLASAGPPGAWTGLLSPRGLQRRRLPPTTPVAVTLANRVIACSASARAAGVRRGLRRRESQARCPELHVVTADPARDARHFEDVTAASTTVPRAEVLRPGLLVLSVRGAARYFGSEQAAAERLVDAVAAAGPNARSASPTSCPPPSSPHGRTDRRARQGRIVLSALSIRQLATEPEPGRARPRGSGRPVVAHGDPQHRDSSPHCRAAMWPPGFGADAVAAHRFARGEPTRGPSGREPPPNLDAVMNCDPPIDRVDAAAFAGRSLAGDLHRSLEASGVGCTRLAIHAITANGEELERVWRCAEPLTEDATADRVRWQLDGWLNKRNPNDRPTAPVTLIRLRPVEVVSAEALQLPLWGGIGEEDRLRARRALVRVQGLLGPEAVQVPVLSGGRGPAERITFTPLGDEPVPRADPGQPWPGQLPEPSPTVLLDDRSSCSMPTVSRYGSAAAGCSPPARRGWPHRDGEGGCPGGPGHGRLTSGGGTPTKPRPDVPQGRRSWSMVTQGNRPCCCAIGSGGGTSRGFTSSGIRARNGKICTPARGTR
jgi:protein ImuB